MHSFIICEGSREARNQSLTRLIARLRKDKTRDLMATGDPDIHFLLPDPTITIDQIRDLRATLTRKPYAAKVKIAVIKNADQMTIQAQHAILKTLEEPSPDTYLFLELLNPYKLIDTIRSRCQLIRIPASHSQVEVKTSQYEKLLQILRERPLGESLRFLSSVRKRDEALQILETLLYRLRKLMLHDARLHRAVLLTHEAIRDLNENVNISLTLEHLAIHFPRQVEKNL